MALLYFTLAFSRGISISLRLTNTQVAAAFAHADMCQWLLDVGVDVNVAAGSKWSATGHPIEFMQYEAGS